MGFKLSEATMIKIVVEDDAFVKCIAAILDPDVPDEYHEKCR
jgi:hypothetical protein